MVSRLQPTDLWLNGGNSSTGDLGPTRLFEVEVDAAPGGSLVLTSGESVGAALQDETLAPGTLVTVPELARSEWKVEIAIVAVA